MVIYFSYGMALAQRITITLPIALHERLQGVKEALNISQLCQRAIEQAVEIEEIKLKEIPVMEKVIERLRLEKQQSNTAWKQDGVLDGTEDAAELSYDEFLQLESSGIGEDLSEWIQHKRIQYLENPDTEAYLEGWKEGALSFWQQVKGQL